MKRLIIALALLLNSVHSYAEKSLSFGIVPQQSITKLAQLWTPIINHLRNQTGLRIHFATAPDIPTFEKRLAEGVYDIAYMNPYHYSVFSESIGYKGIVKAQEEKIKGIIVINKESNITNLQQLQESSIAFPAPLAFAASILTQAELNNQEIKFTPHYVNSHDSVYHSVAKGIYPAGGGIERTLNNIAPEIRNKLKVLWTTKGYTAHAIAVNSQLSPVITNQLQLALIELADKPIGKQLLNNININAFEMAKDSDWDDVRALNIK